MPTSGARSRVASGIALIGVAVGLGLAEVQKVAGQSNRDFARCGSTIQSLECQTLPRPVSVSWRRSSDNGFQKLYEVDIQTGKHTTMFLTDMTATDVAPLQGLTSIDVRYRKGRPIAVIWPDGTPVQIPFAPTHDLLMTVLAVLVIGSVGASLLLWGILRAVRGPRTASYA